MGLQSQLLRPGHWSPSARFRAGQGLGAWPPSSPDAASSQTPYLPRLRNNPPAAQTLTLEMQAERRGQTRGVCFRSTPREASAHPAGPAGALGLASTSLPIPPRHTLRPGGHPGAGLHQPPNPPTTHTQAWRASWGWPPTASRSPHDAHTSLAVSTGAWPLSHQMPTPRGAG